MDALEPGTWVIWADYPKRGTEKLGTVSATPASDPSKVFVNVRFGPPREFNRAAIRPA